MKISNMALAATLLLGPAWLAVPPAHAAGSDAGSSDTGTAPKPKGGALKGAAAGAVVGHVAGGHTKTGALAGAAIGEHEKHKSEKSIQDTGHP